MFIVYEKRHVNVLWGASSVLNMQKCIKCLKSALHDMWAYVAECLAFFVPPSFVNLSPWNGVSGMICCAVQYRGDRYSFTVCLWIEFRTECLAEFVAPLFVNSSTPCGVFGIIRYTVKTSGWHRKNVPGLNIHEENREKYHLKLH